MGWLHSIEMRPRTWMLFLLRLFLPLGLSISIRSQMGTGRLHRYLIHHVPVLSQNKAQLSKRGREREFAKLTDDEVAKIEAHYSRAFPK